MRLEKLGEDFAALIDGIDAGKMVCAPFTTLTLPISGLRRHKVATNYAQKAFPPPKMPAWNGERYEHDIIRVGYLSADFRAHAVFYLTAEIYERHDRSKFEIYGFSLTASGGSDIRNRLDSAFDHIHELQEKSDDEVTTLIKELEILSQRIIDHDAMTEETFVGLLEKSSWLQLHTSAISLKRSLSAYNFASASLHLETILLTVREDAEMDGEG